MWWEPYVKKKHLPILNRKEQYERNKDYKVMENHLYQCIYDILLSDIPEPAKLPALLRYKAKIVRLHARRMEVMLDNNVPYKMEGEEPPLFHILKMIKRRATIVIRQILDMQCNNVSGHLDVLNVFVTHLHRKYQPIEIDQTCVTMLQRVIPLTCSRKYADQLEQPITIEELFSALRPGARHKMPGIDGFSLEFYTANWETINHDLLELLNQMFLHKKITPQQKHGIIICLPKSNGDRTPDGYCPISFLTKEYKRLARIMAHRLRHALNDHLHTSQFGGVPGNSILEAVSLVRDVMPIQSHQGHPFVSLPSISNTPFIVYPIANFFKSYTDMASANGSSRGSMPYTKTPRPQFKLTGLWRDPYPSKVQCGKVVH